MPSPVSRPVAAALGLVPTVLGGVRRLPGKAVQLPVYAVSHALTGLGAARQGYDDLAERGERLLARLRGTSFDEVEDRVEDALKGTPLAKPYDRVEDAVEDAAEGVAKLASSATSRARKATGTATRTVGSGLSAAAGTVEDAAQTVAGGAGSAPADQAGGTGSSKAKPAKGAKPKKPVDPEAAAQAVAAAERHVQEAAARAERAAAEAAEKAAAAGVDPAKAARQRKPGQGTKGKATPKATQPDDTRIDTAAAPDVVQAVEEVSSRVGGTVVEHDQLPLPDYDHLTLGSLRGRMRSLDLPQLVQLRDYEKAHADRLPIITMLDNRIARLAEDPTAPLSGSAPATAASAPDKPKAGKGRAQAAPQTADPAARTPGVAFGGLGSSAPKQ